MSPTFGLKVLFCLMCAGFFLPFSPGLFCMCVKNSCFHLIFLFVCIPSERDNCSSDCINPTGSIGSNSSSLVVTFPAGGLNFVLIVEVNRYYARCSAAIRNSCYPHNSCLPCHRLKLPLCYDMMIFGCSGHP